MRRLPAVAPRLALVAALALAGSCGAGSGSARKIVTARDIVDTASPAVVVVEAGEDREGTGFIVDPAGLVATNLHVIEGESTIRVKLYKDHDPLQVVAIAGVDREHDLALMWIKAPRALPAVRLGDSALTSAGDKIYALGNPLDLAYSISDGLISQVRRLSAEMVMFQFSAPISLGSSGGPLFNQYGEVIGVTTAIVTEGQNINLAMPANYLRPLIQQPQTIALAEFAKSTADLAAAHAAHDRDPARGEADRGAPRAPGDDEDVPVYRHVPDHAVAVLDGCTQKDIGEFVTSIAQAIESGAPLYNQKTHEGFEACFRIYEGTALRFERDAACLGVKKAFGDGLLRASTLKTFKEKAWAMRDTFDGLIDVAGRWARDHHATFVPIDSAP